ncbi:MAG: inorganic diphosphatase [Candidatus Micrarchaeota archaeon]|nr:inorganic diphosphatase [Candidatus Micrarchaeota archaeon]MDE1833756.1 inorganic diphosphatase [Candidatus Micrarchaeota archaeon]MDE1859937.1 inorganic diphosphatase [Candidatus Micrarchaeota archaeon]
MSKLDAGSEAPKKVTAFIEIPKGSHIKYEKDEESGLIKVDRILHTSMVYPYNYGFVPGTLGEDGDPIDIMVISTGTFVPGVIINVRPVAVLMMKDEEGVDSKIMAVPVEKVDPDYAHVEDVNDLGEHTKALIGHFFSYYKSIEPGKWAKVEGWENAAKAQDLINKAIQRAEKKH